MVQKDKKTVERKPSAPSVPPSLKKAKAALAKNDADNAMILLDETIREDPMCQEAYLLKGELLLKNQQYTEAMRSFDKGLAVDIRHPRLWLNKCEVQLQLGKIDQARRSINRVLKLEPNNAQGYNLRGKIHLHEHEYDEAIEAFKKASMADTSDPEFWFNRANALSMGKNDYEEALDYFDKAIELDDTRADFWFNKGVALRILHRFDDAASSFEEALDCDSDFEEAERALDSISDERERYEKLNAAGSGSRSRDRKKTDTAKTASMTTITCSSCFARIPIPSGKKPRRMECPVCSNELAI